MEHLSPFQSFVIHLKTTKSDVMKIEDAPVDSLESYFPVDFSCVFGVFSAFSFHLPLEVEQVLHLLLELKPI
jgi:hypothetical protein